jgi:hypothetical protein
MTRANGRQSGAAAPNSSPAAELRPAHTETPDLATGQPEAFPPVVSKTYPLRIHAGANLRLHWAARAKRTKSERDIGMFMALHSGAVFAGRQKVPMRVHFVRILGKRGREMDSDNLPNAFKAIRDGFAKACGVSDGPRGPISWTYAEERGTTWGVRVELSPIPTKAATSEPERSPSNAAPNQKHEENQ